MKKRRRGEEAKRRFWRKFIFPLFLFSFSPLLLFFPVAAQKIAVIAPDKTAKSEEFVKKLAESLSKKSKIIDASLSETAFASAGFQTPFNLTAAESKTVALAIGCDYFVLIKSENLRRASFQRKENFESYAAIFVISSRTGRLIFWKLQKFEAETANEADKRLFASTDELANEISDKLKNIGKDESAEKPTPNIIELPDENSSESKGLRPPLPFRRIKPEYTQTAYFYSVEATVDIEIEVGKTGEIIKAEIVRWAGYGLDESVKEAIYKMQWRPADKNGKTLPMRVLLRYNFKKIED